MSASSHYVPALCSSDLAPLAAPAQKQTKFHRALIHCTGAPAMMIQHAARGITFALLMPDTASRWYLVAGGNDIDGLRPEIARIDQMQRRWRVVEVATAIIREEG